jgi:hypothetical protein
MQSEKELTPGQVLQVPKSTNVFLIKLKGVFAPFFDSRIA